MIKPLASKTTPADIPQIMKPANTGNNPTGALKSNDSSTGANVSFASFSADTTTGGLSQYPSPQTYEIPEQSETPLNAGELGFLNNRHPELNGIDLNTFLQLPADKRSELYQEIGTAYGKGVMRINENGETEWREAGTGSFDSTPDDDGKAKMFLNAAYATDDTNMGACIMKSTFAQADFTNLPADSPDRVNAAMDALEENANLILALNTDGNHLGDASADARILAYTRIREILRSGAVPFEQVKGLMERKLGGGYFDPNHYLPTGEYAIQGWPES